MLQLLRVLAGINMDLLLRKTINGWVPDDQETAEYHAKQKPGSVIHGDFRLQRLSWKHKKFFAMLKVGYEFWEPPPIDTKWGIPEKSYDNFRENLLILAGYGYPVFDLTGKFHMKAKSISFSKMDQEEFDRVYENVLTVLMRTILVLGKLTKKEIDDLIQKYLEFA